MSRTRRKEMLLEFISDKNFLKQDIFVPNSFNSEKNFQNNLDDNFIFQDKFCVKMETKNFVVNPDRIKGFKIEKDIIGKIIKIKTYLQINEWLNDFKKIEIIKIYFFDNNGNILKNCFDYDVEYVDFKLECDYKFRDYLTPIFIYQILD